MRRRMDPVVAALLLILGITLRPKTGSNQTELLPFTDIWAAITHPLAFDALSAVVGNVLLFIPLGAALWSRGWSRPRTVIAGASLSISIELAQLAIPGRTTSFDDALLNTIGCELGWLLCTTVRRVAARQ